MKKILPYIFVFLIIANLFAPFSVGINSAKKPIIKKTLAQADGIILNTTVLRKNDTTVTIQVDVNLTNGTSWRTNQGVIAVIKNQGLTQTLATYDVKIEDAKDQSANKNGELTKTGIVVFSGLSPNTIYNVSAYAIQTKKSWTDILTGGAGAIGNLLTSGDVSISGTPNPEFLSVITSAQGESKNVDVNVSQSSINSDALMPVCGLIPGSSGSVAGCIAQLLYYAVFVPTSFLLALTGQFFDFTFAYSVNDQSYRSDFVVQGWGVVRDFCNMFFIFVLLYIAFATMLNLHGAKPKEMIINVVIIGLLINFSLFTAQVVIDASNIMARVFYNDKAIVVGDEVDKKTGQIIGRPGTNNEIQLSAALVNKIQPQRLILEGRNKIQVIDKVSGKAGGADDKTGLGVGAFILLTLLASAVNVVGMIVFLSVGMIFIARVIGLWMSMIFAPLAFFTYTVPSMQGWGMVGWRKWWPELLSMAFLAPVFIFFLYLIIKFLNTGLGLVTAGDPSGSNTAFVLSIVVPFAFIMVLLMKAKDIAKSMSGSLGQSITNGVAAVGGLAIGGAALGAAALGRSTLGAVGKYTQNDSAREKDAKSFGGYKDWSLAKKLNPLSYAKQAGKTVMANAARPLAAIGREKDAQGNVTKVGYLQREAKKVGDKAHAVHTFDEKTQALKGDKNAKYADLTESEQKTVQDRINRDIVSKTMFNKIYDKLNRDERAEVDGQKMTLVNGVQTQDPHGTFSEAANIAKNTAHTRGEHIHTAEDMAISAKAPVAMSEFINALRKGSYDVRNLSQITTTSKGLPKTLTGVTSFLSGQMRNTIMKGANINYGSGQKDFIKDLNHTISEAMKSAKVKVDVNIPHGDGGGHGGDSHGGGHH